MLTNASRPEQLWFALRKAAALLERQAEAIITKEAGVSLGTFMVLSVLHAQRTPVSQQAIADRLGLTKGTVSRLLDGARQQGLATSDVAAASRRERAVSITEAGIARVDAGDAALLASNLAEYARIQPTEAEAMITSLHAFADSLEQASARAESPKEQPQRS